MNATFGSPDPGSPIRTGRRTTSGVVAAAVVALYLVVAALTSNLSGRHTLPLFEGVGPPPDYQWVNPPSAFAAGNVVPEPGIGDFPLGSAGNDAGGVADSAGQFVVNLGAGAIPPRTGEKTARIRIEPLDPATLPALPDGLRPDGNAYRIVVEYASSRATLDSFAHEVSAVIGLPLAPVKLFVTEDARQWREVKTTPAAQSTTLGARFRNTGVFLVATTHTIASPTQRDETSLGVIVAAVIVACALVGGGVFFLLRLRSLR